MDDTVGVDLPHALKPLPIIGVERGRVGDAGIVDQDRDGPEFGVDAVHHRFDRRIIGDVGADGDRLSAHGLDFRHQGVRRVGLSDIIHRDRDTFAGQTSHDGTADAAGAPGHQCHLVTPCHLVPSDRSFRRQQTTETGERAMRPSG